MERSRRRDRRNRYTVYVTPAALRETRVLPGNVRQRVRRAIDGLTVEPRPQGSQPLTVSDVEAEIRRLRLDNWRIIYAITEADRAVDILAVRKRPPYDYGDLHDLIEDALGPEGEPRAP